jgi:hypothetical protein
MPGYDRGLVRKTIPAASLLSFTSAFEAQGRTFLVSPDMTLVPSDRVRPFRTTSFHGVEVGPGTELPLGWTRASPRAQYRQHDDGSVQPTGASWPPRTLLRLTDERIRHESSWYRVTRDSGLLVREQHVSVLSKRDRLPFSVQPDEKWIDFSIRRGLFTLYVGSRAVYTTLASPGAGGAAPRRSMSVDQLVQGSYTPRGIYRVTYKTRVTTMTPEATPNPQKHWIADVPYTQYFRRPFAIHAAYWHEDFGQPKSGGCVNLSPMDARHVFHWTEPRMPDTWSGVSSSKTMGLGTKVVLRR